MKYHKNMVVSICLAVALTFLNVSPAFSGDSFADIFSQTRICYSHIAVDDGWETEVAVINPTQSSVTGSFTFYDITGRQLGDPVTLTLAPHGRYQVEVGAAFGGRGSIEYMIFTAPIYGLRGYSKFYNDSEGIRASIIASPPRTTGLFAKIEDQGWTGIAFVNTSSETAHVILTAYSNAGKTVAVADMYVKPGEKVVRTAEALFSPSSINEATYVSFTSSQGVVGFYLNGSPRSTGHELDGSRAL